MKNKNFYFLYSMYDNAVELKSLVEAFANGGYA